MEKRTALTSHALFNHAIEQLHFLEVSLTCFPQGRFSEAKRIATSLRLLSHPDPKEGLILRIKSAFQESRDILMLDKIGIDHLSFVHDIPYYIGVHQPIVPFKPSMQELNDIFPALHSLKYWLEMTIYRDNKAIWSRDDAIKFNRNKLGGGHLAANFDTLKLESLKRTKLVCERQVGKEQKSEEVPALAVVLYEAGISMYYSLNEYLGYIRMRVETGEVSEFYANNTAER